MIVDESYTSIKFIKTSHKDKYLLLKADSNSAVLLKISVRGLLSISANNLPHASNFKQLDVFSYNRMLNNLFVNVLQQTGNTYTVYFYDVDGNLLGSVEQQFADKDISVMNCHKAVSSHGYCRHLLLPYEKHGVSLPYRSKSFLDFKSDKY